MTSFTSLMFCDGIQLLDKWSPFLNDEMITQNVLSLPLSLSRIKKPTSMDLHGLSAKSLQSCLTLATLWTVAYQAPLSMGFSRQEYWNGLPCPPPGDLLNTATILASLAAPALQAVSLLLSHRKSLCACVCACVYRYFILLYIPLYMNTLLEKISIIFISLSVCDPHQSLKKLLVQIPNY